MRKIYQNITAEEAKYMIDTKDVNILDVRSKEEYENEKIEGAMNISFGDYDFDEQVDELSKEKPVIVYCNVGIGSLKAIDMMEDLAFEEVYNMLGGIDKWREKGYEIK